MNIKPLLLSVACLPTTRADKKQCCRRLCQTAMFRQVATSELALGLNKQQQPSNIERVRRRQKSVMVLVGTVRYIASTSSSFSLFGCAQVSGPIRPSVILDGASRPSELVRRTTTRPAKSMTSSSRQIWSSATTASSSSSLLSTDAKKWLAAARSTTCEQRRKQQQTRIHVQTTAGQCENCHYSTKTASSSSLPIRNTSNIARPDASNLVTSVRQICSSSSLQTNTTKEQNNDTGGSSISSSSANLFHTTNRQHLTMANIQKLALEPTREHIENIRLLLRNINAKDNNDQLISLEKDDESGIGIVCIKSAAKNGISAKMMCDFLDVIDQLYAWPRGKGVLIYGHNGFFCSGGDLVSVRELANYEDGLKMATLMQFNLSRLQALPMITMSLIQGKAIGGGAEVAVTTDLRAMASSSLVGYVHCRVGIMAAWGGGSRLVQLVGPSRALELMTSGRLVTAKEARELGLVNEIIDDSNLNHEQVLEQAKQYLRQHIASAKSTLMAIKNLVNAARTLPLEQALVVEGQLLSSTWGKPAHLEALNNNVKHRGDQ